MIGKTTKSAGRTECFTGASVGAASSAGGAAGAAEVAAVATVSAGLPPSCLINSGITSKRSPTMPKSATLWRFASGSEFATALESLELLGWSLDEARRWWSAHRPVTEQLEDLEVEKRPHLKVDIGARS